jgi:hypothetical protein
VVVELIIKKGRERKGKEGEKKEEGKGSGKEKGRGEGQAGVNNFQPTIASNVA